MKFEDNVGIRTLVLGQGTDIILVLILLEFLLRLGEGLCSPSIFLVSIVSVVDSHTHQINFR